MTSYARVLTSSAERVQMTRDRRRRGVRLAQNVEFTAEVAEFLVVNGYLDPEDTDNADELGAAITAFMADVAR